MNGHQKQKEQSKQMIETALFELMKKKNYLQITVSEIADRAGVSRRTFYRLYEGKEEIIHSYFDKLCREYCHESRELEEYHISQIAADYFSFWYRYREVLLLLYQNGLEEFLYCEINHASLEVIKKRIGSKESEIAAELQYFAAYSAGGFGNLLHRWIMDGMQEEPKEYALKTARAISKFIRPVKDQENI
jgi:AcrR family transcriptional regulator